MVSIGALAREAIEREGSDMTLLVSFPGTEPTTLAEVGGKGYSLIRMVEAGLPVPPGAVIAREYGKPCVAGIDRLMTKLHDGQRVEVERFAEKTPDPVFPVSTPFFPFFRFCRPSPDPVFADRRYQATAVKD